jgi:photosystem II stability/assembly factor-like uncharacterized protein
MSLPFRNSMKNQLAILSLITLIMIALTVPTPSAAFDAKASREATEAWLDEMHSYFEAHPELRDMPGSGWKPYNRAKWFLDQRRADGELPDPMARWRAWEAKREIEARIGAYARTSWFQLGPTRFSGRIIDIEFHPTNADIVYAGAASGGLWKSTDGGDTWQVLTDHLPSLAVGGIVVLPWDPDVVLIGTGEGSNTGLFGRGIFKSIDGGQTWNPTNLTFPPGTSTGFHAMEVNAQTGTILAGSRFALYRSTDEGDNWTQVQSGNWSDVKWKPGDPARVYAAKFYGGVYVSTDDGLTWSHAGSGQPNGASVSKTRIAVSPADPNVIYAHYCDRNTRETYGIYRSTDDGNTWLVRNNTINMLGGQGNYNLSLIVDPDNIDRVVSGGVLLYGSYDGGVTWTVLNPGPGIGSETNPHVDNHAIIYEPGSTSNLWIGTDGGVWRSSDDGETWRSRREGLVTYQFYDICVAQSDPMFMMGGTQDNGVPGRQGIDTWFQTTILSDGMVCNITPTNANEVFAEKQRGIHYKSTDGGHNWFFIISGITGTGLWVTPVDQDQNDPDHLYTSTDAGIFRTTNGGALWVRMTGAEDASTWLSISPIDGNSVWSLEGAEARYSTDDGETWTTAAPYGFSHNAPLRVHAHPTNLDAALVTFGGYTPLGHIGYTTDMGQSWEEVSGDLPVMPVNTIVVDPSRPDDWYIGTDVGVWMSSDGGEHWLPFEAGLPNAIVLDLEIQRSTRKLVAGTYGRGVWEVDLPTESSAPDASDPSARLRLMLDPPLSNPVASSTVFRFAARTEAPVTLEIHDVAGRRIDRVASYARGDGTVRVVNWDSRGVTGGVYFAVLRSGRDHLSRRLVVVR